ncbi:CheY-like protein, partial [Saitoella complicata NRRL Y-17804]
RVLVVEDNPINAMILSAYLSKRGILHQKAFNGALAVDTVKNDREGFDLVLMDLQMPVMDGFEASEAIRSYEAEVSDEGYERKKTRICALTGLDTGDDREKARRKGIDDFLTKPVSLDKMDRVI